MPCLFPPSNTNPLKLFSITETHFQIQNNGCIRPLLRRRESSPCWEHFPRLPQKVRFGFFLFLSRLYIFNLRKKTSYYNVLLKCFFHFWFIWSSFRLDGQNRNIGEPYYDAEIEAMKANESTTMFIDFSHVMLFNDVLQKAIADEYFRYTKRNDLNWNLFKKGVVTIPIFVDFV